MLFWQFAWRNLGRNRKRTLITGAGIAVGVGLCIGTLGIMEGLNINLIKGTTDGQVGHVQIHHPDFLDNRRLRQTVNQVSSVQDTVVGKGGVTASSARLYSWGYLTKDSKSVGIQLLGVQPDQEAQVTQIPEQVIQGEFVVTATPWGEQQALTQAQKALDRQLTLQAIDSVFAELEDEQLNSNSDTGALDQQTRDLVDQLAPLPDVPPAIVLGTKLAKNLKAQVGDQLALLYENALGAQSSIDVTVAGISRTGTDLIDRTRVIIHIEDMQKMLQLNDQAHEVAIRLAEPKTADSAASAIGQALASGQSLSVKSWSQLRPDILALILSNQVLIGSLVFIVFLITGVSMLNAMLVSVMERQREISTVKALGFSVSRVTGLIMVETFLLTVFASIAGIALGLIFGGFLKYVGWDIGQFGEFSISGVGMGSVLRAEITLFAIWFPLTIMFVINLLAALYPAIKAARVSPAAGMRST